MKEYLDGHSPIAFLDSHRRGLLLDSELLLGVALTAILIVDFVTRCIHIYNMHITYACTIQVVSNMLFSGSSYWSREERELRSHLDTLRDMHVFMHGS